MGTGGFQHPLGTGREDSSDVREGQHPEMGGWVLWVLTPWSHAPAAPGVAAEQPGRPHAFARDKPLSRSGAVAKTCLCWCGQRVRSFSSGGWMGESV